MALARAAALVAGLAARQASSALQARGFAAAAASKTQIVLPEAPLGLFGTAPAIATLTWQLAKKENQLEKVQDELWQVVESFKNPKLMQLAVDPFLPVSTKVGIIKAVLADSPATEIVKRLFISLAEENALTAALTVAEAYDQLMLAHRKEVHCNIITAAPLDKLEKLELRKQAEAFVEPGFKLVMQEKVDKKLLGGFILEFEDRLVDMSVSKKLEEFNNLVFKLEGDLRV